MEVLSLLLDGFSSSMTPLNIVIMTVGITAGLFIGALPGLGSVNGVAILLPMTFIVPPASAIIFLGAVYYGAMYGGAVTSILLGIPGESNAVATTFDGRPMAVKGEAGFALVVSAIASFVGGTLSVIMFTILAQPFADFALAFGPPEEFALVMLAFTTFVGLGGEDPFKTMAMIFFGLVLSTVGLDMISGQPRLVFFDIPGFYAGISFLVVAIGVFGVGEVLLTIDETHGKPHVMSARVGLREVWDGLKRFRPAWKTTTYSSILGFLVGLLPAAGATTASLMAYGIARSTSRTPEAFGKGSIEGLAAPEAANNAASTGSLLPMLTLGIPGGATTAVLLGGMVMWGLMPGPMLFIEEPEFVWGLISSLYVANVIAVALNIALIPLFVWSLRLPFSTLSAVIITLCVVGAFAPDQRMHDVWLVMIFGLIAYALKKCEYPLGPLVLALVLGPLMEKSFRQTLIGAQGDALEFVSRPISGTLLALAAMLLLLPIIRRALGAGPLAKIAD